MWANHSRSVDVVTNLIEYRGDQVVKFSALALTGDRRPFATIEHESVYQLALQTPT